jgi:hypothetical protein
LLGQYKSRIEGEKMSRTSFNRLCRLSALMAALVSVSAIPALAATDT